jgi:hypothetical protein
VTFKTPRQVSAEILLTNSFHGCYWGTLAGARVIAINPCSSRMQALKYPVPFCMGLDYKPYIEKTVAYPEALEECRSVNLEFAKDVSELLGVEIKPL